MNLIVLHVPVIPEEPEEFMAADTRQATEPKPNLLQRIKQWMISIYNSLLRTTKK